MQDHHTHVYPLIIVAIAGIIILGSFLLITPRFIGEVIVDATGGQVSTINFKGNIGALSWIGLFGNLTSFSNNSTIFLIGGQVMELDLEYVPTFSNETVIIASTTNNPNWDTISAANYSEINAFLGLVSSDEQSAENTLSSRLNVTINSITHEVWSTTLNSVNGSYMVGALISDGELLFITQPLESTLGFNGNFVEYQLLIPIPLSGNANFSFFVFEQSNPSLGVNLTCNNSINISAVLASDNQSVLVYWDSVPGALSYELQYIDGPSNGFLDFSSFSNVSLGNNLSWVDLSPSNERYYRLAISDGVFTCLAPETVGTLLYELSPDFNLISSPFLLVNNSVSEVLRSIDGNYSTLFEFNNTAKTYTFYAIIGNNIFKTFDTIKPGLGYWVEVANIVDLRISGSLIQNMSEFISPDFNLLGFPVISNVDHNETVPYILSSIDGNYSTLFEFNNTAKTYTFYAIIGNNIFKTFDTIKPGLGYWIEVNDVKNVTYANS